MIVKIRENVKIAQKNKVVALETMLMYQNPKTQYPANVYGTMQIRSHKSSEKSAAAKLLTMM